MTCPCFSLPHSLSLPPPPLWGVGRSVGFRPGGFFSGGCPVCCCCSLRDPLRGAGVQTGVGSLALEEEEGVSWCGAREGITAPEGVGRDCRSDLGVQVCVRVCGAERAQRRGWPALAGGLVEARGVLCGVCLRKRGGGAKGQIGKWGKEALPSLSLSGLSLAPSSAGGAPCTSPRERSVRRLSSVRPSLILILFHMHPPLPPSGAAQTPRHLQRHQKGLCWGACRLYPGLRGCSSGSSRRKEGAESCCLLRVRSGVKATRKESEAWGEGAGCYF